MSGQPNILGLGHYVPDSVLTNADLEEMVETSDEWITTRTGIKERRIAAEGQGCADLGLVAAQRALEDAGCDAGDVTHILLATFTPDYCTPTSSCVLQGQLGATRCQMAADVGAGCSGFLYSLDMARGLLALDPGAVVLVVGSEVCTARLNFSDRNTCVLFGDGAGAAVLGGGSGSGPYVVDALQHSDGTLGHLLPVGQEGGSARPYQLGQAVSEDFFIQMKGRELFRHAVRGMADLSTELLNRNGLSTADIDLFIPHQANLRIIEALAKKLDYPMHDIYVNVDRYGNTSAASVIIALSEAYADGRITSGDKVLLTAFGAGLTWGSALLQF
jgi:3-oxoacyl-[acyl-carrier-protein] synthase-3